MSDQGVDLMVPVRLRSMSHPAPLCTWTAQVHQTHLNLVNLGILALNIHLDEKGVK